MAIKGFYSEAVDDYLVGWAKLGQIKSTSGEVLFITAKTLRRPGPELKKFLDDLAVMNKAEEVITPYYYRGE
jgi:hypothetical protein